MPRGFRGGERRARAVAELVERDGDHCWYCGFTFTESGDRACTIDHVIPRSEGGPNHVDNLRLACFYCNMRRGRMPQGDFEQSETLTRRRRHAYRTEMLASGRWLPKHAFHHVGIRWLGEWRWHCDECGHGSESGTRSPASVPCVPWCTQSGAEWVMWWHEPHDPPADWPRTASARSSASQ